MPLDLTRIVLNFIIICESKSKIFSLLTLDLTYYDLDFISTRYYYGFPPNDAPSAFLM